MNERIRELEMQADEWSKYNYTWTPTGNNWVEVYMEKFALLIIQECIGMADEFEIEVNRSGLVDRIKEHFGVEE